MADCVISSTMARAAAGVCALKVGGKSFAASAARCPSRHAASVLSMASFLAIAQLIVAMLVVGAATLALRVDSSQAVQPQQQPKLVDIAREYSELEGSSVTLVCSLSSGDTSDVTFEWLRDDVAQPLGAQTANAEPTQHSPQPAGSPFESHAGNSMQATASPTSRVKVELLPNKEHSTLKIVNLTEADAARYSCVARNSFGVDKISTRLRVKGKFVFSS